MYIYIRTITNMNIIVKIGIGIAIYVSYGTGQTAVRCSQFAVRTRVSANLIFCTMARIWEKISVLLKNVY